MESHPPMMLEVKSKSEGLLEEKKFTPVRSSQAVGSVIRNHVHSVTSSQFGHQGVVKSTHQELKIIEQSEGHLHHLYLSTTRAITEKVLKIQQ